jgi:prepilin-type N-terminal cleavage/methylation domain-containing protein
MNKKGLSLMEMMVVVALFAVVAITLHRLISPVTTYFQHGYVRQKATNEARACLNTIGLAMRGGIATSVRITTPTGAVAWSSIRFELPAPTPLASGTTAYTFALTNGNVQMTEYAVVNLNPVVRGPTILASNVTKLTFASVDIRDPSLVIVSLRIDAPLDKSNRIDRVSTVEMEQEIHMVVNY